MKKCNKIASYIIISFIITCLTGCSDEKLPEEITENESEQIYADVLETKEKEEQEVKEQETKETEEEEAKEQTEQEDDEQAKLEAEENEAREQAMKEREELEARAGAGEQISVNGKKLLKSKASYNADGTLFSEYIYSYDSQGNLTWVQLYWDGELFMDYVRRCDEEGRLIRYIESNDYGRVDVDKVYSYDINGNLTRMQYYSYGRADLYGYEEYSYDAYGRKEKEISCSINGKDGYIREISYICDSNGNVIKEVCYDEDGTLMHEYNYNYDSQGNKTDEKLYVKKGVYDTETVCSYDAQGNKINEIYYENENLISKTEYSYDSQGNMVNRKYNDYYYEEDISIIDTFYDYDEQGNIISEYDYNIDGEIITYEIYQYW